ncbi:PLP-dependent cysteine synthase family protein [Wenzhouxiangella sp. AB-CW3]|uniref:PLP-dependent cysteine synthase family protein n=1 Tax=Wenzhouxiangella sp. AB-CW3 TaxID=2771012 RepID=UPI00168BB326|nr:PLP-dependent cysteine synthase family protein [Wenzhouxiangella sp. AB-CW3]QOC23628.1 PLP-dependent cysteine synthase family protein [Wenzhouxiangella sp. AB-CW3]
MDRSHPSPATDGGDCRWTAEAIRAIEADFNRSADTHLIRMDMPEAWSGWQLYLKDESIHPTGSLKHRLARSLFLYGLCNGWIGPDTPIIEASSGSTAVSEAYFARLLGLRFIAVMPDGTSPEKIAQIEFYGGECRLVEACSIYDESDRLARELGGHFMDQFTYAERATDWRGNNNIAESLFSQMALESHPHPRWVVVSAGTGGTAATIGRYMRIRCFAGCPTDLCVVDPENSVFHDYYKTGDADLVISAASRIEGIGRPRVEPSFIPSVVDRMMTVPDAASMAAIRFLENWLGRKCGGSTGTNLIGSVRLLSEMREQGERGSVVTLLCDDGQRYRESYFDDDWLAAQQLDIKPWLAALEQWAERGVWDEPGSAK